MTRAEVRALVHNTLREVPTAAERRAQEAATENDEGGSPRIGRQRTVSRGSDTRTWQGPR